MITGQALDIVLKMAKGEWVISAANTEITRQAIEEIEYLLSIYDCDRDNYNEDEYC